MQERMVSKQPELSPNSSYVQKLHLELLKQKSFNHFNGERIARDLENNRDLWTAATLHSFLPDSHIEALVSLESGDTLGDYLLIATRSPHMKKLQELAETWQPDGLGWLSEWEMDVGIEIPEDFQVLSLNWMYDGFDKDAAAIRPPTEEWPIAK